MKIPEYLFEEEKILDKVKIKNKSSDNDTNLFSKFPSIESSSESLWGTIVFLSNAIADTPSFVKSTFVRLRNLFRLNKKIKHNVELSKEQKKAMRRLKTDRKTKHLVKKYVKDVRSKIAGYKYVLKRLENFSAIQTKEYLDGYKDEIEILHLPKQIKRFEDNKDYFATLKIAKEKYDKQNTPITIYDYENVNVENIKRYKGHKKEWGTVEKMNDENVNKLTTLPGTENIFKDDKNVRFKGERIRAVQIKSTPTGAFLFYLNKLVEIKEKVNKSKTDKYQAGTDIGVRFNPQDINLPVYLEALKRAGSLIQVPEDQIQLHNDRLFSMWMEIVRAQPKYAERYNFLLQDEEVDSKGYSKPYSFQKRLRMISQSGEEEESSSKKKTPKTSPRKMIIARLMYLLSNINRTQSKYFNDSLYNVLSDKTDESSLSWHEKLIRHSIMVLKKNYVLSEKELKALSLSAEGFEPKEPDKELQQKSKEMQNELAIVNKGFIDEIERSLSEEEFNKLKDSKLLDFFELRKTIEGKVLEI